MADIKLKYLNSFRNKNRKDKRERHLFRAPWLPKAVTLEGEPGSEPFMQQYWMLMATEGNATTEIGAKRTQPGTIDALVVNYYKSSAWLYELGEETRKVRRSVIEKFREQHGEKRVALLRQEHILGMLGKIDKPTSRLNWLKAIRHLMQSAIPSMIKSDPTSGINIKVKKTKGHHTWNDLEIEQYRAHWPLGSQARLVFEFALETASRRGEVTRLGPQHILDGRIKIARTHGSKDVDIPITSELAAAIAAMPRTTQPHGAVSTMSYVPISKYSLGNKFREWANAAGLPARCRMHGLKKASMTRLAFDGCSPHELMSISGHRTLAMVQLYTEEARSRALADQGMAKRTKRDADVTNTATPVHKHPRKPLKNNGRRNEMPIRARSTWRREVSETARTWPANCSR
jgi:integrase